MLLCVPQSWVEQTQILASIGGKEIIAPVLEMIQPITALPREDENKAKSSETVAEKLKKQEVKVEKVEAEIVEEPTAMLKPVEEDKITMSNSKICPVKIVPVKRDTCKVQIKSANAKTENNTTETVDEAVEAFKAKLTEKGINFTSVKRVPTGLVEVALTRTDGQPTLITVDLNDKLYGLGADVFFIGKINPLDEYTKKPLLFTDESLNAVINSSQIDPKYYVPDPVIALSTAIDAGSVHEHNVEKKKAVVDKAFKAVLSMEPEIKKSLGTEPYRFSFTRYKGVDNFSIVSGKKSRVSNLHDQKLLATRTVRIDVDGDNVTLNIK